MTFRKAIVVVLGVVSSIMGVKPRKELVQTATMFWDEKNVVFQFGNLEMTPLPEEIGDLAKLPRDILGLLIPENCFPWGFLMTFGTKKNHKLE